MFFGWNIEHCVPDLLGLFDSIGMLGLSCWLSDKEFSLQCRRCRFDPWVGEILWRRKWQPTAVFLPGKSHGWRSLVSYSPWGRKESDTTKRLHFHFAEVMVHGHKKEEVLDKLVEKK